MSIFIERELIKLHRFRAAGTFKLGHYKALFLRARVVFFYSTVLFSGCSTIDLEAKTGGVSVSRHPVMEDSTRREGKVVLRYQPLFDNKTTTKERGETAFVQANENEHVGTELLAAVGSDSSAIMKINALNITQPAAVGPDKKRLNESLNGREEISLDWHREEGASSSCVLSTPTVQIESDDYTTQLWFYIANNQLFIHTTANLDISLPGVGIQFGGEKLQAFSDLLRGRTSVWQGDLQKNLQTSDKMRVVLGVNELSKFKQELTVNLEGLKSAYYQNKTCQHEMFRI